MQRVIKRKVRFASLQEEMDSIHLADKLYLERGEDKDHDAIADYHARRARLREILSELAKLRN